MLHRVNVFFLEDINSMPASFKKPRVPQLTHSDWNELRAFQNLRRGVIEKWNELSQHGASDETFSESPDDWLARTIYGYLGKMVQSNAWRSLEKHVERDRSLEAGARSIRARPFKVGLIAFLGKEITYGRNRRKELSDAMEYAYIHRVPTKHFSGFVKQAGQKRIAAKLAGNHVEPGFLPERNRTCP